MIEIKNNEYPISAIAKPEKNSQLAETGYSLFSISIKSKRKDIYKMELTRRFPLTEDFMNYRVDDLLYGYLQYKATYNPIKDRLYITSDNLRKSKKNIETLCGCSRRTIDRQINSLIQAGMVEEITEDNRYIYSLPCVGNRY